MKNFFFKICSSNFSKKIDDELRMIRLIEKNAFKKARENERICYENYLKQKQAGLLPKDYIELEYKNLEDIIYNRIDISAEKRFSILKNLTEENFSKLKIDNSVIEDLKKYKNSNDNFPFKVKINKNNNESISNVKMGDFLNQNFSINKETKINVSKIEDKNNENIRLKNKYPKLERSKFNKDGRIFNFFKINPGEEIINSGFVVDPNKNNNQFDRYGRDKALFEYVGKKFTENFEKMEMNNIKTEIYNRKNNSEGNFMEKNQLNEDRIPSELNKIKFSRVKKFNKHIYVNKSDIKSKISENSFENDTENKPNENLIQDKISGKEKINEVEEIIIQKSNKEQNNHTKIENTQNTTEIKQNFLKNENFLEKNNKNLLTFPDNYSDEDNFRSNQVRLSDIIIKDNSHNIIKQNAKSLPYAKKEIIYEHDLLQIITSLKTIEFKTKNIPKLLDVLSIIRRKKKMKTYDLPEIANALNFISNCLTLENNNLPASYSVNFLYTLSEMQNFDEDRPSLKNDSILYEILNNITPRINTLTPRSISNLLFALQKYQNKNPKVFNFTDFLDKLEEVVVKKFTSESFTNICLTQVIVSYSKCQAGSEEFYRIFTDIIYNKKNILNNKDISIILYSYSNNLNCNEKLLTLFEDDVIIRINKLNSIELCNIARAYERKNILSEKLRKKIIEGFIEKHENIKILDLSYLYKILAKEDEIKFLKYSHSLINNLCHDIDAVSLLNLMFRADLINKIDNNLFNMLKKLTIKFIDKKSIKGFELRKIYELTKDLPFEGKYNTFIESIVRHLEKIKYY